MKPGRVTANLPSSFVSWSMNRALARSQGKAQYDNADQCRWPSRAATSLI